MDIIEYLRQVDFRELLSNGEKLSDGIYQIGVVKEVLATLDSLGSGIITMNDRLYHYNGKYWEVLDDLEVMAYFEDFALACGVPEAKAIFNKFKKGLLEQLKSTSYHKPSSTTDLKINLQNGTLWIHDNNHDLRDHDRDDHLTYILPFKYDPNARSPKFDDFLHHVLPEEDKRTVILEFFGSVFDRNIPAEKMLLAIGDGANGKSVLFNIMIALIGAANLSQYTLEELTNSNGYYRAECSNKFLNISPEISGSMKPDKMKALVSGEGVSARSPYARPSIIKQFPKMAFSTNLFPPVFEQTEGFFRRFIVVPFEVTIAEPDRNPMLAKEIIETELAGILNRLIDGLSRFRAQTGYSQCSSCDAALDSFRHEIDNVGLFLSEEYQKSSTNHISLEDMYRKYKLYCSEFGYRSVSKRVLSQRIRALGVEVKRGSQGYRVFVEKVKKSISMPQRFSVNDLPGRGRSEV